MYTSAAYDEPERASQNPPALGQRPARREEAAIEAQAPDAHAGEEPQRVVERAADLDEERPDVDPAARVDGPRERHVGDAGQDDHRREEDDGALYAAGEPSESVGPARREPAEKRADRAEQQEDP